MPAYSDGQRFDIVTRLYQEPDRASGRQRVSLQLSENTSVTLQLASYPVFHYGEKIHVTGNLRRKVLPGNRVVFSSYFPKVQVVPDALPFFSWITSLRLKLIRLFQHALPEPAASLLVGIVFGIKMTLSASFYTDLQHSGVLHVVAASGMNVVLVSMFLFTFHRIFFGRKTSLLLTLFGLIFYTVLSGLDPSIIRASVMAGIATTASILGRQYTGSIVLFFTAYLMLLWHPSYLESLGFQLSFLSTLGIMFIKPYIMNALPLGLQRIPLVSEDLFSTVSAQLATNPLLLYTFGTINILSILINALVLWTIPFLMVIGGVGAIIGLFVEPVGKVILWMSMPLLAYFIAIISFFSHLHTNWQVPSFSGVMLIGYYFLLISGIFFMKEKYGKKTLTE